MSRQEIYNSYTGNSRMRTGSPELADLHVYIVPPELWRERYNNLLNQDVAETISAGIIRVPKEYKVCTLRDELESQLGKELLPNDYIFLKSVGRSITRLKPKQEFQLKVKHFLPPNAYAPELYLLEVENRDDENDTQGSTRPTTRSPQFTESEDERQSNRYRTKPRNATSPYRYTSPLPKIKTERGAASKSHDSVPHYNQNGDIDGENRIPVNNSWGGGGQETRRSPRYSPPRRTPPPHSPPPSNNYPPPQNDYPDTTNLHESPTNSGDRERPIANSHQPVASKYDPRSATYTNQTNDSGIAGLTPEDYRDNYDDAERRKNEYNESRQKELQNRLNGEHDDNDHQGRQEDRDREDWERKHREEEERRRREEEERRRREEEERKREEDERRRREEEREKMAREKLSGSDEGARTTHEVPGDTDWRSHGVNEQPGDEQRSVHNSHQIDDSTQVNSNRGQVLPNESGIIQQNDDNYRDRGSNVKVNDQYGRDNKRYDSHQNQTQDTSSNSQSSRRQEMSGQSSRYELTYNSTRQSDRYDHRDDEQVTSSHEPANNNTRQYDPYDPRARTDGQATSRREPTDNSTRQSDRYDPRTDGQATSNNTTRQSVRYDPRTDGQVTSNNTTRQSDRYDSRTGGQVTSRNVPTVTITRQSDQYDPRTDGQATSINTTRQSDRYDPRTNGQVTSRHEPGNNLTRQSDQYDERSEHNQRTYRQGETSEGRHRNDEMIDEQRHGGGATTYRQNLTDRGQGYSNQQGTYDQYPDDTDEVIIYKTGKVSKTFVKEDMARRQQHEDEHFNRDGTRYPRQETDDSNIPASPSSYGHNRYENPKGMSTSVTDLRSNAPGNPSYRQNTLRNPKEVSKSVNDLRSVSNKRDNPHQSSFQGQNRAGQSKKAVLHYHKGKTGSELNRFPSPPPMHSSVQGQDTSNMTKEQKQAETPEPVQELETTLAPEPVEEPESIQAPEPVQEPIPEPTKTKKPLKKRPSFKKIIKKKNPEEEKRLLQELEAAREARRAIERQREELVKKAKLMQNKTQNRRNHARDLWKKRYFEEKKRTPPLEEQCNKLRHELDVIHRKLMNALEGSSKDKNTRMENLKPSKQNNYKIQATRLTHEIDDLRRRLENAKMKLTAEMKLRNQAETELRALRAELTQKKIHLTLARNQHMALTPGPTTGDNRYNYRTPALSNKA